MCESDDASPIVVRPGTRFASLQALAVEVPSVSVASECCTCQMKLCGRARVSCLVCFNAPACVLHKCGGFGMLVLPAAR